MPAHPKLLIASGIFHPEAGGPATYLHELLPALQSRGHTVRVLTYGSDSDEEYPYPVTRVPRRALPLRRLHYARTARSLLDWADVVYVHSVGLPLSGSRRAPRVIKIVGDQAWERAVRRGWIAPTEDIDHFQTARYGPLVEWAKSSRSRNVRSMDGVIVPSAYLQRMVIGWGVDEAKVQVIYNALPPQSGQDTLTQAEARSQLGLGDEPLLLTAARLHAWKGVDHLISALQQVRDVHLIVAGEGPLRAQWEHEAQGLGGRVTFLGNIPRERLALCMRATDYVVLYSGYEGLSHTLLESLRAGTPVIASDKGGNPEVVQHGVNGLLVPYVDVEALAATLEEAFKAGRRDALAANSQVGRERFTFETMIEKTAAALETFAGGA